MSDAHESHEELRGLGALSQRLAELRIRDGPRYRLAREIVDRDVSLDGFVVHAERERGVREERIGIDERHGVALQLQSTSDRRLARAPARRRLRPREDHFSRASDVPGVPVVVAHEALDGGSARAVTELVGELLLLLEAQPIGAAPRREVKQVANPIKEPACGVDLRPFSRHEDADADELAHVRHLPARARRPVCDVEIAQAALAVLHVGFEQEHRSPEALVTLVRFCLEGVEKAAHVAGPEDTLERALEEMHADVAVAGDRAPVEERRRRRQVAPRELEHVLGRHDLVTDVQSRVP